MNICLFESLCVSGCFFLRIFFFNLNFLFFLKKLKCLKYTFEVHSLKKLRFRCKI